MHACTNICAHASHCFVCPRTGASLQGGVDGALVGAIVGSSVGARVGSSVGSSVGCRVGWLDGLLDGGVEGVCVGANVGMVDGVLVGLTVGTPVGARVGAKVGASVNLLWAQPLHLHFEYLDTSQASIYLDMESMNSSCAKVCTGIRQMWIDAMQPSVVCTRCQSSSQWHCGMLLEYRSKLALRSV